MSAAAVSAPAQVLRRHPPHVITHSYRATLVPETLAIEEIGTALEVGFCERLNVRATCNSEALRLARYAAPAGWRVAQVERIERGE